MLGYVKRRLITFYWKKIKNYSDMDITIMKMRKAGISVGDKCRIFSNIQSTEPYLIAIGNNVTISSGVSICTHDNAVIKAIEGKTDVVGRVEIGDNCFIGMNATLMYGVTLGESCIVGAGSVVTRSFPPHTVLAGNPAKAICTTEQYAQKYREMAIDFRRMSVQEKREYILQHPELWIKR